MMFSIFRMCSLITSGSVENILLSMVNLYQLDLTFTCNGRYQDVKIL